MIIDGAARLLLIGNSGSGKSTLARHLGHTTGSTVHDLDLVHWLDRGTKRDEHEARAIVSDIAARPAWIMEGVYGWLAEVALDRATALIWMDLPWAECRDGLLRRGLRRGMTAADQDALLAWAEQYWTRTTPSSFAGHTRLFGTFPGDKLRLDRAAASDLLARSPARGSFRLGGGVMRSDVDEPEPPNG